VAGELEEYQVTRYILALKGFQFITGIIAMCEDVFGFWSCTVLSADGAGCVTAGPGVTNSIIENILLLVYRQCLLWIAVLLLPFAGRFQPKTGVCTYTRSQALLKEAKSAAAERERTRQRTRRGSDLEVGSSYKRLADEGTWADVDGDSLFDPASTSIRERLHRLYLVAIYPIRAGKGSQNRLLALVYYDSFAFMACGAVFALLAWSGASLEYELDRVGRLANGGSMSELVGERYFWVLSHLVLGDGLDTWRCRMSFGIAKMLFALSAFPFFPISMGGIGTLFTHADPTAYTAEGKLTQLDSVGLSNYLTWLREDVLDASRFQAELNEDFDDAELKRLRDALESGERFLEESWKFGAVGNIKNRCLKKKREIQAVMKATITRTKASDALYQHVFPNEVLVEKFVRQQAEAKKKKKEDLRKAGKNSSFFGS